MTDRAPRTATQAARALGAAAIVVAALAAAAVAIARDGASAPASADLPRIVIAGDAVSRPASGAATPPPAPGRGSVGAHPSGRTGREREVVAPPLHDSDGEE